MARFPNQFCSRDGRDPMLVRYNGLEYDFFIFSSCFRLVPLLFLPRRPAIFLSLVLLPPCSSYLFLQHVRCFSAFLISLLHTWYLACIIFHCVKVYVLLPFLFSGLACVVVLSDMTGTLAFRMVHRLICYHVPFFFCLSQ